MGLQTWSDQALVKDTEVYNNTLIDNTIGIRSWARSGPFQNSYVKNNIVWITGKRSGCSFTDIPSATGITFDYNLWSSQPSPSFLRGAHDPGYAAPLLAKTTGWNTVALGGLSGPEFALQEGSPARNAGANLGSLYSQLVDVATANWLLGTLTTAFQPAQGAWDIGGARYEGQALVLSPPNGLMLVR